MFNSSSINDTSTPVINTTIHTTWQSNSTNINGEESNLIPALAGSITGIITTVIVSIILFLVYWKRRRRCKEASSKILPDLRPPPVPVLDGRDSDSQNSTIKNFNGKNKYAINDINELEKRDTLYKLPDISTLKMTPTLDKVKLLEAPDARISLIGKASSEPNINNYMPKSKATNSFDDTDVKEYIDMTSSVHIKAPSPHKVNSRGYVNVVGTPKEPVDLDSSQESDNYFNSQIALTSKEPSISNLETMPSLDFTSSEDHQQDEYINMSENFSSESSKKQDDNSKIPEISDKLLSSGEDIHDDYINLEEIPINKVSVPKSYIIFDNAINTEKRDTNNFNLKDESGDENEPEDYINMETVPISQKLKDTEDEVNCIVVPSGSTQITKSNADKDLPKDYINIANMNLLPSRVMSQKLQEEKVVDLSSKNDRASTLSTIKKAPPTLPKPKSSKMSVIRS